MAFRAVGWVMALSCTAWVAAAAELRAPTNPTPAHQTNQAAACLELRWQYAGENLLTNGGFESASLAGWSPDAVLAWRINDSERPSSSSSPLPAAGGRYNAWIGVSGTAQRRLSRSLTLPSDASRLTLTWSARVESYLVGSGDGSRNRPDFQVLTGPVSGPTRTNFSLLAGDRLSFTWSRYAADLSDLAGKTISLAFAAHAKGGSASFHLDEVQVEASRQGPATFDVYLGTNSVLSAADYLGRTTEPRWTVADLSPATTYFWQVVAESDGSAHPGPAWSFTTANLGPVRHFEVRIPSTGAVANLPLPVTITARDAFENRVPHDDEPLRLAAFSPDSEPPRIVVSELVISNYSGWVRTPDGFELQNVSGGTLRLPALRVTCFDAAQWPEPAASLTLTNVVLSASQSLTFREGTGVPGQVGLRTYLDWTYRAGGQTAAVLVQDGDGNLLDFVCVGNADPAAITHPTPIPFLAWLGPPLPSSLNVTQSWQRVGDCDSNQAGDWARLPASPGVPNDISWGRLRSSPAPVPMVPERVEGLSNGVLTASVRLLASGTNVTLAVVDAAGRLGLSDPFNVAPVPPLVVEAPAEVIETAGRLGGAGKVSIPLALTNDLVVALSSSDPAVLAVGPSAAIPAGDTAATFDLLLLDNPNLEGPRTVDVTATAESYAAGVARLVVNDDETARLTLTVSTHLHEGEAPAQGTVTASAAPTRDIEIRLTSDAPDILRVPATVILPAGQTSVGFELTPVDNSFLDGLTRGHITAQVPGWTPATAEILVDDNEAPTLALRATGRLVEGAGLLANAVRIELGGVTRTNVFVTLTGNDSAQIVLPSPVEVPAGTRGAALDATLPDNAERDGTRTQLVALAAPGFAPGSAGLEILDNDPARFAVSTVPSPQEQGVLFDVALEARDINGELLVGYEGTADFSAAGSSGAVPVSPSTSGGFADGRWTGQVALLASGLDVALSAQVPGAAGLSNPFDVLANSQLLALLSGQRDLVADPVRPRLYVTVADESAPHHGWLLVVNPYTGEEDLRLDVGDRPELLAISDDGRFLYVSLTDDPTVVQVDLERMRKARRLDLRGLGLGQAPTVLALTVAPRQPEVVAVLCEGEDTGVQVVLFDQGHLRLNRLSRPFTSDGLSLCFGETAGRLYLGTLAGYERLAVDADGVTVLSSIPTPASRSVYYADARLLIESGEVYEAETGCRLRETPLGDGVNVFDRAAGRLFRHRQDRLEALEFQALAMVESVALPANPRAVRPRLVRWGDDGFAFLSETLLHIVRSGRLLAPARSGDLEVHQSVTPQSLVGNEPATLHLTVANRGPTPIEGVVVAEALPSGLTILDAASTQGSCTVWQHWLLCPVGTLPARSSATLRLTVQAVSPGEFSLAAFATHSGADPNPANNSRTAALQVANGLAAADVVVNERGEGEHLIDVPVRLAFPNPDQVSVRYETEPWAGFTYTVPFEPASGELTFAPGETRQTLQVRFWGNQSYDGDTPFFVRLFSESGAPLTTPRVKVTILEDDPPPVLSVGDATVREGRQGMQSLAFPVHLEGRSNRPATVSYQTVEGTAVGTGLNADYGPTSGTLLFSPGVTDMTVSVSILGDTVNELDEQFGLVLTNAVDAVLRLATGVGTIRDDDFGSGEFHHVAWDGERVPRVVGEAFPVTLRAFDVENQPVTSFAGSLRLGAAALEQLPSATLLGDVAHTYENSAASPTFTLGYRFVPKRDVWLTHLRHYFGVKVSLWDGEQKLVERPLGAPLGAWAETSVEPPVLLRVGHVYTVGLYTGQGAYLGNGDYYALTWYAKHNAAPDTTDVDVEAMVSDTGDTRPTRVGDNWEKPLVDIRYVVPSVVADSTTPALTGPFNHGTWSGLVAIDLAGAQVFLMAQDDAGLGGCSDPVPVYLPNDVVLSAVSDKPRLTVGQQGTFTLTVTNVGPATATGVVVSNRLPAGIELLAIAATQGTHSAGDGALRFDFGTVPGRAAVSATIVWTPSTPGSLTNRATVSRLEPDALLSNNEALVVLPAYPVPELTAADSWTEVVEGGAASTNLVFTVMLSVPSSEPVVVDYALLDDTALAGSDFEAASGTLTFAPGMTNLAVNVTVKPNTVREPVERFLLAFTNGVHATLPAAPAVGTIYDNNPLPVVSVVTTSVTEGDEDFADQPVRFRLSRPTSQLVYGDLWLVPGTAKPISWQLPAPLEQDYNEVWGGFGILPGQLETTLGVPIVGDRIHEPSEYFSVAYGATQGATTSGSGLARITILDNDPIPQLTVAEVRAVETDGPGQSLGFVLQLSAPTVDTVRVSCQTVSDTAVAGADFESVSRSLTFPPGVTQQSLFVPVIGDTVAESDEQFYLRLVSASGAQLATNRVVATIHDNDPGLGGFHHFAFARLRSPQTAAQPFEVRLWASDASDTPVTNVQDRVALRALVGPPAETGHLLGEPTPSNVYPEGGVTLGLAFTPSIPLRVTHLRHYFGVAGSLWRADGTLLARVPLVSQPGQWQETPLAQAVELAPGQRYMVGVYAGSQPYSIQQVDPGAFMHGQVHKGYTETGDVFPRVDLDRFLPFVDLRYEANWPRPASLEPREGVQLANGVWRGLVTLPEPALEVVLEATTLRGAEGRSDRFQVQSLTDADGDGLDDNWELRYGLVSGAHGALADPDQDGASNLDEFRAGTDPTDASRRLRVVGVNREGDVASIRFTTELGRLYRVETSPTLHDARWSALAEAFPGTGETVEAIDSAAGSAAKFYRIRLAP